MNEMTNVKTRVSNAMKGYVKDPSVSFDEDGLKSVAMTSKEFPAPEMVRVMLLTMFEWRWYGPEEKRRWTVFGVVDGHPVGFQLRKFELCILVEPDKLTSVPSIIGRLKSGLKIFEGYLSEFAQSQLSQANVSIANRLGMFRSRYEFYRSMANKAFGNETNSETEIDEPNAALPSIVDNLNAKWNADREGFFHAATMIDAYFSALEHQTVLLRAFIRTPIPEGGFQKFLSETWGARLSEVFDFGSDYQAGLLLGALRRIKERVRNPMSHGGLENDGGAFFFHIPGIGALPATLSKWDESIHFGPMPIDRDAFEDACRTFDAFDELLMSGPLSGPNQLIDAGIDPSFDRESLAEYAKVCGEGAEAIEAFCEEWSAEWARHANMDY